MEDETVRSHVRKQLWLAASPIDRSREKEAFLTTVLLNAQATSRRATPRRAAGGGAAGGRTEPLPSRMRARDEESGDAAQQATRPLRAVVQPVASAVEPAASAATVMTAMVAYSLASSGMMIVNKMVMRRAPLPSFFSTIQFLAAVITVQVLARSEACTQCPRGDAEVRWSRLFPYLKHSTLFVAAIYTNMQALRYTSIETIIVFRASTPLVVSALDVCFLGREWPSPRSLAALLVLTFAAGGYVLSDHAFQLQGFSAYWWVALYYVTISLEMAYAKWIVGSVHFDSMWGPVLHNNLAAMPMMALLGASCGELATLSETTWDGALLVRVVLSCVVSVGIAYTGWNARKLVSASCFTVLGVGNKLLTILINNLIWKQVASPLGNLCLFVCLLAAVNYQQAPMRSGASDIGARTCHCAAICRALFGGSMWTPLSGYLLRRKPDGYELLKREVT